MGMFKEEAMQFEQLMRKQNAGYIMNGKYEPAELHELRNWMKDMADLRIEKHRHPNLAIDRFYVAWDQEGNMFTNGTIFTIMTSLGADNHKIIRLTMTQAALPTNCYKN